MLYNIEPAVHNCMANGRDIIDKKYGEQPYLSNILE